jgi:hypothetical protein
VAGVSRIAGAIQACLRPLPLHRDSEFFAEAVVVMEFAVGDAVFVDHFGELDVEAAVFGDLHELALAEPFDGLETFRRFFETEGGGGDGVQGKTVLESVLQFHEHVQCRELAQVHGSVAVEDFVIETEMVETDDEVGALEFREKVVDLFFAVNFIVAARGGISNAHAHAHGANLVPTADILGGFLRFQVEINDVLHRLKFRMK